MAKSQKLEGKKVIGIICRNGGSALKCWICKKQATRTISYDSSPGLTLERDPSKWVRCYCDECREKVIKQEQEERELYIKLKKREMFRRAVNNLEKQHTDMYAYREAIDTVENYLESNPDKFDSSYEVLAAIVLIQNRVHIKPQYKIGHYQVDFLLPEYSLVLEIDGDRHKSRKNYDTDRDKAIKKELGPGWEIMRVLTEYLDANAKKLPTAIDKFLDFKNDGHINWRQL